MRWGYSRDAVTLNFAALWRSDVEHSAISLHDKRLGSLLSFRQDPTRLDDLTAHTPRTSNSALWDMRTLLPQNNLHVHWPSDQYLRGLSCSLNCPMLTCATLLLVDFLTGDFR